ncbi:MAG: helix-turn-helix domain-containing protein [Cytophagales bacterium]|nr:helix-turn-helix domain-containing protein [Cytophagales bacterium]|tara:strand:- start:42992 stop:43297 length:306 start_codon:yes stop_codon:yes gene_type:complete
MENKEISTLQIQGITAETLFKKFEAIEGQIKALSESNTNAPTQEIKLLSRQETAQLLGVSLVTIHNWVKGGIIKAYRVGNKVRFKEPDILEALKQINSNHR